MLSFFLTLPLLLQATPPPTAAGAGSELPSPTAAGTTAMPAPSHAPSGRILRLDDVVQTALKAQPAVLQARASTAAASGQAYQARSGLLPQVTGTALYERTNSIGSTTQTTTTPNPAGGGGGGLSAGGPSSHDLFSFGVQATQLIYDFNQTPDKLRAANRNVDSFRQDEHTTELQVLLNVRRAFFTARADKALVYVAEQTLRNEEKHVTQIRGYVAAGTHPEIDLVQELTTLANDRVSLISAQNNYEIAKAQLNQSMGVVADTDYDVADQGLPVVQGEDGPDERLLDDALRTRPELAALIKSKESDELTIASLKGGYGPTLSAFGSAGTSGLALGSLNPYWTVGGQLVWPFFQGGLTTGQVRTAEANRDIVDAQLEAERLQVRFDVQQAVLTLRAAKASIEAANEALTNARQQLRLAEGRYQAGVGSIIELGDAQVAATNAAAQVVQADFNLSTARAQLLTALGRP
jgi:outer membrane protein